MNPSSHQKSTGGAQRGTAPTPLTVGTTTPGLTQLPPDSPHNFSTLGRDFLAAATLLNSHHPNSPDWPTFFLVCQALELYLKAFLRYRGLSTEDLKKPKIFGHDLQLGLNKAMELKLEKTLDFTHELGNSITLINQPYKERDFQYLRSGSWELPPMGSLISLVEKAARKLNY